MILQKQLSLLFLLYIFNYSLGHSQNLLNTSSWTVGSGSVTGFTANGTAPENVRELGLNHIGEKVVLWKAVADIQSNEDGGWNSSYHPIDNTKSYRFSVWIKKTNSYNGSSFFGCQEQSSTMDNHSILGLNGNFYNNPYFWHTHSGNNQLPHLNRWYLLVGFIHHKDYVQTTNQGAIYDGVTGELVQNIIDFKFHSNTTEIRHRAYLYYDTNTNDRQYFYEPRIDAVNTSMPTVDQLLKINQNSKLLFGYDNAGNQNQRFYCAVQGCSLPTAAARSAEENTTSKEKITLEEKLNDKTDQIKITLSPNPTKGLVLLNFNSISNLSLSHDVNVYNNAGVLVKSISGSANSELSIDLTNLSSGMYLVHIHLSNGTSVTKQIIKN